MKAPFAWVVLFAVAGSAHPQVASLQGRPLFVPDEVLVEWKEGTSSPARTRALASIGESLPLKRRDLVRVKLQPGLDVTASVERLRANGSVRRAQPNFYYYALACGPPTDQHYAVPLTILGSPVTQSWPFLKIKAPQAWDLFTCGVSGPGSASVTVAVLDSGVTRDQPDLRAVPLIGYNAITDTADSAGVTASADDFAHGTYVAGIIAAQWGAANPEPASCNNGITSGIASVAPGITLMPIKVLDNKGSGKTSDIIAGADFAVAHGARILNFSLGSPGFAGLDEMQQDALDRALAANCVIVAAAGNEIGAGVDYPAAYPPVVAVGATDRGDNVAYYSNIGPGLDLVAPGGQGTGSWRPDLDILSSFLCPLSAAAIAEGGFSAMPGDGNFGSAAGTSASAPFVSGAAALVWSMYPALTNTQVVERIVNNADSLNGGQGWDARTGYGRLNLYRALLPAPTQTPEITAYLKTFNSPNPFYLDVDKTTNITLAIGQAQAVELLILDAAGEVVLRKNFAPGELNNNPSNPQFKSFYVPWDGLNGIGQKVKTGVYFYSVKSGEQTGRNKIVVIQGSK